MKVSWVIYVCCCLLIFPRPLLIVMPFALQHTWNFVYI